MKKKILILVIFLVFVFSFSFIGITEADMYLPKPAKKAVWQYITVANPYTDWIEWPGLAPFHKGAKPHGEIVRVFVNTIAYNTIINRTDLFTDGAMIVQQNFSPDKKLMSVTVMYKVSGYDAPHNDWFWAHYGPNGMPREAGKIKSCINCHVKKDFNDYIMGTSIR